MSAQGKHYEEGRLFHKRSTNTEKALSLVATHLISGGGDTESRASQADLNW